MAMREMFRYASLAAVLLAAGSCTAPSDHAPALMADGAANHPIIVEPNYTSIKLAFSARDAGLMPEDAAKLDAFVEQYLEHGSGAISISAPTGESGNIAIRYFGERLSAMGVPQTHILVGQRNDADQRVELGYVAYTAHTDQCGNWEGDATDTFQNQSMPNFGCSVQHNIAAMVSDPRDLTGPRPMGPSDAMRRATVMNNYEKGQPTPAVKGPDQSGAVAEVGK